MVLGSLALAALVLGVFAWWWETLSAWRTVASRLGLTYDSGGFFSRAALTGEFDGVALRVVVAGDGYGTVAGTGLPTSAHIESRGRAERLGLRIVPEIATGDADLDGVVTIAGDPRRLAAALDVETRRNVRHLVAGFGGRVEDGRVEVATSRATPEELRARLEVVAQVARALAVPDADIGTRLRHNAAHDPNPGVRRRCLRLLADTGERDAARTALADSDPLVALQACLLLGKPIAGTATGLLASLAPEDPERVVAAAATGGVLQSLHRVDHPAVRVAVQRALGEAGGRVALADGGDLALAVDAGSVALAKR